MCHYIVRVKIMLNKRDLCFSGRRRKERRKGGTGEKAGTNVSLRCMNLDDAESTSVLVGEGGKKGGTGDRGIYVSMTHCRCVIALYQLMSTNLASVLVGEGGRRGGKEEQGENQV